MPPHGRGHISFDNGQPVTSRRLDLILSFSGTLILAWLQKVLKCPQIQCCTTVLQNTKSGLSITTAYKVHIRQNIFLSVQVPIHRESIESLDPLKNDQQQFVRQTQEIRY